MGGVHKQWHIFHVIQNDLAQICCVMCILGYQAMYCTHDMQVVLWSALVG
jgi:hypothetical protein